MSVYVDDLRPHNHFSGDAACWGTVWCHLIADSDEELHAFAGRIGLKAQWAQYPGTARAHYDLLPTRRARAVALGAIELSRRELVTKIKERRHAA